MAREPEGEWHQHERRHDQRRATDRDVVAHATWVKIAVGALLPLVVLGIVALILMRGELTAAEKQMESKASTEVVNVQYKAITDRLDELSGLLRDHMNRMEARTRAAGGQ